MATYNEAALGPDKLLLAGRLTFDPTTKLPGNTFRPQRVKTLLVANGATVLVYDVTNPQSPVLINTIG